MSVSLPIQTDRNVFFHPSNLLFAPHKSGLIGGRQGGGYRFAQKMNFRRDTDIPVCSESDQAEPANAQTGMSVPPLTGIPASPIQTFQRYLPHWRQEDAVYWVTFRLADSLPQNAVNELRAEKEDWLSDHPEPWNASTRLAYHLRFSERINHWLDAGHGCCALNRPEIRSIVRECLLRFDGERLKIHSGVIMPNHVHVLLELLCATPLSTVLKGIKGASARLANSCLQQSGTFWMEESYDHIVRSETEYRHLHRYIQENPSNAGLRPDQYCLIGDNRSSDLPPK